MNRTLLSILLSVAALSAAAADARPAAGVPQRKSGDALLPAYVTAEAPVYKSVRMNQQTPGLSADFGVKGSETETDVWSQNFDAPASIPQDWSVANGENVKWTVKRIAEPGNAKSFSAIDPGDVASLFVEGPYQMYKREKAHITTDDIAVPSSGATLRGYFGFTKNYDDECRLIISASTDGFKEEDIEIWNSKDATGERPWAWREESVSLDQFAGKTIRLRLTYAPGGKDTFNTGGYMGDFAIDGLRVSAAGAVESIDVLTGETIDFVDRSSEGAVAWKWEFPGAVPESSAERNPSGVYYKADGSYDVSLTVTDAEGRSATSTRKAFVRVTGTEPQARIGLPATFRYTKTRLPMIAPMVPVVFKDASAGFPDSWAWAFTGVDADPETVTTFSTETASVGYAFLHEQGVSLSVANSHGRSETAEQISVEYSGTVTNFRPDDTPTVFDLEGRGEFPGTNSMKITAYAEKFSKPSVPVVIDGAYVFFTKAEAKSVVDQIANVGVHLYTSENGLPGKRLDSMWWSVFELDLPGTSGSMVGTAFPFTEAPVVDDEFFIVVDGIPEKNDSCTVAFAMADFRASGNTSYMLKDGEWVDVSTYFPAGKNHTSFLIQPSITHSVMSRLPVGETAEIVFDSEASTRECEIFSIMGYKTPVESTESWCRVVSTPNGMTVDKLVIAADALPAGMDERRAEIVLTDGATSLSIPVVQRASSGVAAPSAGSALVAKPSLFHSDFAIEGAAEGEVAVFDISGRIMARAMADGVSPLVFDGAAWPAGVYIVRCADGSAIRVMRK